MTTTDTILPVDRTEDGITVLRLIPNPAKPRGGVVVLDAWLLDAIDATMTEIAAGPTPTGFVLASDSERVFVAGADLAEIDALDDEGGQIQSRHVERLQRVGGAERRRARRLERDG